MKKCKNCGVIVPDDHSICHKCGSAELIELVVASKPNVPDTTELKSGLEWIVILLYVLAGVGSVWFLMSLLWFLIGTEEDNLFQISISFTLCLSSIINAVLLSSIGFVVKASKIYLKNNGEKIE